MQKITLSNTYGTFFETWKQKCNTKKKKFHQFFNQLKCLKEFDKPEDSKFLLSVVVDLFDYAITLKTPGFCSSTLSLAQMGKQVSLYIKSIVAKAPNVFNETSNLRSVLILNNLDLFHFKTCFLGYLNKNDYIKSLAGEQGQILEKKWEKIKSLEEDAKSFEEKLAFVAKRALIRFTLEKEQNFWKLTLNQKIVEVSRQILLIKDPNSQEDRLEINKISQEKLFSMCTEHLIQVMTTPNFCPFKEKVQYPFYPDFKIISYNLPEYFLKSIEKIEKRVCGHEENFLKDLEGILEDEEDFLEKKRCDSAKIFEIYAQGIDDLQLLSSSSSLHLGQYIFVRSKIEELLKETTKEDVEIEMEILKKNMKEWIEESRDEFLFTLKPALKTPIPGVSTEFDGYLIPVGFEEIEKLLIFEIPLTYPYLCELKKINLFNKEVKGLHEAQGSSAGCLWGAASAQGLREYQEDDYIVNTLKCIDGKEYQIFAIMDGHSGKSAANFVKRNLVSVFTLWINCALEEIKSIKGITEKERWIIFRNALRMATKDLDNALNFLSSPEINAAGTTLVATIFDGVDLWNVNVGDSRVLVHNGEFVVQLSRDAKPSEPFFKDRVIKRGGYVENGRVNGSLAMAGSIGDRKILGRSPEGDVTCYKLSSECTLILLSDGITDCMSSQEIGEMAIKENNPLKAAKDLVERASILYNEDNMTALVVKLPFLNQSDKN